MAKRMTYTLIAAAAVLTALGMFKYDQVQAAIAEGASYRPPPEAVTTLVAGGEHWNGGLSTIGTVVAVEGVTVSADLPGIVKRIRLESGRSVTAGDILVELDTRQEEAQAKAAEARLELAKVQLDRMKGLREKGVTSQAEYDLAFAEHAQAEARLGEIRATMDRKTIRAPFSGVLGIRQVALGQYLAGGDPVVPLQSLDPIYVDFAVPQQQIGRVATGTPVRAAVGDAPGFTITGAVEAIDSVVDEGTRNLRIRAAFANPDQTLRPGMFVEVGVDDPEGREVVALPMSAISYAPYGDSVYVVAPIETPDGGSYLGVQQRFVELGSTRGDQVAVLSGLESGEEVVTSGVFKLHNGAAVLVNNDVQPGNDSSPTPENS